MPKLNTIFSFGLKLLELKEDSSKIELPEAFIPENKIEYSIQDLMKGRDKEMEFILNDLKK